MQFFYVVAHSPQNTTLQQLLKTGLAPGALVMPIRRIKYPPFSVLARPGVGFLFLARSVFRLVSFDFANGQYVVIGL